MKLPRSAAGWTIALFGGMALLVERRRVDPAVVPVADNGPATGPTLSVRSKP
jgi:hypothetical protein